MFDIKYMEHAMALARAFKFDPSLEYMLCAIIVKGGRVLSLGYNSRSWNSLLERYRVEKHVCTTHAEMDAILSQRKKTRFKGSKMYVVRIKRNGTVGNGKPCPMCQQVIYNYGIRRVIYSVDDFPFADSYLVVNPTSKP